MMSARTSSFGAQLERQANLAKSRMTECRALHVELTVTVKVTRTPLDNDKSLALHSKIF
jgi:hypothetical protein